MRILIFGHGRTHTGYGRVLNTLAEKFQTWAEVIHFAVDIYAQSGIDLAAHQVPNNLLGDLYGKQQLPRLLEETRPDLFLLLHDHCVGKLLAPILNQHRSHHPTFQWWSYVPIEWPETPQAHLDWLRNADGVVAFCDFGKSVIVNSLPDITHKTHIIGHGVDLDVFGPPAESRVVLRKRWFGHDRCRFAVLNANRHVPRKRLILTLEIFARFVKNKEDAYLVMHPGTSQRHDDLREAARTLQISDRVIWIEEPFLEQTSLNQVYACCDVGMNTSTGEGWGLVAFEHAASGGVQLQPNHSACSELWREHGLLMPLREDDEIDLETAACLLESLYESPELRTDFANRGMAYVQQSRFNWHEIGTQWKDSFYSTPSLGARLGIVPGLPSR